MLEALGKLVRLTSITDTKSETMGHSFELIPKIEHRVRKYLSFGNYRYILQKIREIKPVAILLEKPFMGPLVYLASKRTGIPFYVHAHNIEFLRYRALGKWWYPLLYVWESFTFSKSKSIFFISEEDRRLAIQHFKLPEEKCLVSPYGIPQKAPIIRPQAAVNETRALHGIQPDEKLIMFFGVLKYLPNIEAMELVINEVLPRLAEKITQPYKLLICGAGLSETYQEELRAYPDEHLIYAGFVHDIDEFIASADVIINPVLYSGGIRTRVVEALGYNKPVVSTLTGAHGIDARLCGSKLKVVADTDWDGFVNKIVDALSDTSDIPETFFNHYSWEAIAGDIVKVLSDK